METQTTPTHDTLWNKGFWALALANLLLTMGVYMMLTVVAGWLRQEQFTAVEKACIMGAYGVGLFALGPFCSYLVERYRRNHVCELAIVMLAFCIWMFGWMQQNMSAVGLSAGLFVVVRMAVGALFGLAQMVLSSTLVIDVCESFQRTKANHAVAWFSRFAMCLGAATAISLQQTRHLAWLPDVSPYWVIALLCIAAAVLIQLVPTPFRAPSDAYPRFSLDRFLLPSSWPLFLLQAAFCASVGYVLAQPHPILFYLMMLAGLAAALTVVGIRYRLSQQTKEVKRWGMAVGFIVMAGCLGMTTIADEIVSECLAPLTIGFVLGLAGTLFLTTFLDLSNHCQRGTSQSSHFLAWEVGIAAGLFLAFATDGALAVLQVLLQVGAVAWFFVVHPWYLRHKMR